MNSPLGSATDQDERPLVAVADWPGVRTRYQLGGTGARPELAVTVSAEALLPGPDGTAPAGDRAERYRTIGAQLDEPGPDVSLLVSLVASRPLPVIDGVVALRRFARSAELFAHTVAAATAPDLTGLATLAELLDRYGLTAGRLAAANADRPLHGLLAAGQPLAMRTGQLEPDVVPTGIGTLAQVAAGLGVAPGQLLEDNRGLRLAAVPSPVLPGIMVLPPQARVPYPVRAGDTLAALAQRFASTARELVAGNAEVPGTLLPGLRVEVPADTATVSADTIAGDSFAAVHARLAGQHAGLSLDAVADALDRLGPVLSAGPVLSCPLAVLGGGRDVDGPLTGADAAADFGCPPAAFAAANAALPGLLQPGVRLSHGSRTTTTTEQDTLHAVLDRLGADASLPWPDQLDRLLADHATVPLFRAGARALLPPAPAALTAAPGHPLEPAGPAVPLTVTLRLARGEESADTRVPPGHSRDDLVEACLAALPGVRLGTDPEATVWAVPFGDPGIASVRISPAADGAAPLPAFGLPALYPALLDFAAPISTVTERGELSLPVRQQISAADAEPWARLFVTDLDRCLAEPLRDRLPDTARATLAGIRRRLADSLAGSLTPVLPGSSDDPAALATARTALASLGRAGLGQAYLASVVGQYPATATGPYGGDGQPAARLVGSLQAPEQPELGLSAGRIELAPAAGCTFALSCADPSTAPRVSVSPHQVLDGLELDLPGAAGSDTQPVPVRFARPLAGSYRPERAELPAGELPAAELPVPLREHPKPVVTQPMTAAATFAGPGQPTLSEALRWTASLSYTAQHAAQDVVRISAGRRAARPPVAAPVDLALAEALARYAVAAPELIDMISSDAGAPEGVEAATRREQAAVSLTGLVAAVATAWQSHPAERSPAVAALPGAEPRSLPGEARLTGGYHLRAVYAGDPDGGRSLDRLVVSRTGATGSWPHIIVEIGDRQLELTPGPVAENTCEYAAAGQPAVSGLLAVRLDWPGLLDEPAPGTAVALSVQRNLALWPGATTAPAFVLTGSPIGVGLASPALRWSEPMPLPGDDLAQALRQAFEVLAGGQPERRATIEVHYAEPFGESQYVQPALLSEAVLSPDSATSLTAAMQDWQRQVQPTAPEGATWQLKFTVHSLRDGEPPLVTFEQLVYPIPPGEEPALVPVPVRV
ncbi:MAG: LysM peptidoglycan-binding domain-containing protein [Actinobacteria bacterium]|nr:LysM peptidoglycan-binding domain-containing protein [Actinomycetota bacterium]